MRIELPFFTIQQLAERYGVHAISIRRWVAAGLFPQPVRFGPRKALWPTAVVEDFERAKVKKSQSQTPIVCEAAK
jgi:predicted DNA-binding transcriptional regulator AlpA